MGGVYERMVGIVKRALRRSLGKDHLQTDQLSTLLTEIEAVVNTRPLLYVTSDEVARTSSPADFVHSHVSLALPPPLTDPALAEDPNYQPSAAQSSHASQLFKVWLEGQKHLNNFWRIWLGDYLLNLRELHHHQHGPNSVADFEPQIGHIVLIHDNVPCSVWVMENGSYYNFA